MIISPQVILAQLGKGKIIRGLSARELVEPEGVGFDLSLGAIARLESGAGSLGRSTRRTPGHVNVEPTAEGVIDLMPGIVYLATTAEEFELPSGLCAFFFPRSTLFRSGVDFQSSVLPPGYIGPMTFGLRNDFHAPFSIEIGARFAHVIFAYVDGEISLYKGQWQHGRITQPNDEEQI